MKGFFEDEKYIKDFLNHPNKKEKWKRIIIFSLVILIMVFFMIISIKP